MYYVRREGRIKGPLTRDKLCSLRQEQRLRMRDEVSESPDGPWRMIRDASDLVLVTDDSTRDDSVSKSEEPLSPPGDVSHPLKSGESEREWHASLQTWVEGDHLFRKPFRLWKYLLGGLFLVALAIYATTIVLQPH